MQNTIRISLCPGGHVHLSVGPVTLNLMPDEVVEMAKKLGDTARFLEKDSSSVRAAHNRQ